MGKKRKKQAKPKPKKKQRQAMTKALTISQVSLTETQTRAINERTPTEFIKYREGRGRNKIAYVEGGYVVARLNTIFGPLNWNWEVMEHGQTDRKVDSKAEGEVWVKGRLTIMDHKNGYRVAKDSFGQHPIHPGTPFADSLKSASTDALKKAAAQGLGIALDVYWTQMEDVQRQAAPPKEQGGAVSQAAIIADLTQKVKACQSVPQLMEWDKRVIASKFTQQSKDTLRAVIRHRVQEIETTN